ncbi:diacylglycerol/lipid kinase family protein [Halomonas urumqiensis]|uniref:Diacylglycerol kinase n=1 Tax=Halomonas urumqiensis TaxID=1684789 RepID=A0A2N7UDC2_9GAMM|nr:diacylglycerol kinase family protein [Halomonas urumqiensis]PMR78452.1 diacylglycerol kinase [Halomonas urumqiensis]PTB03597.1 diacylglycerol kinase [Halomonas urumqiensis]GHE20197.1 putative lipid kinase YegS-like protein [Halomonas urumqiensis]
MRKWLIVNDKAGDGRRGMAFWLAHLERAGVHDLNEVGLGDDHWEDHLRAGDLVLVAGGDGSVNRIAGVCIEHHAILGVLPSGTANDFSRNLGLPTDPAAICRVVATGRTARADVGWVNDRLFLNVVHVGLGALPATDASASQKKALGRFSYLTVLAQKAGLQRGFHASIGHDGECIEGQWLSIAIASGAFFGGGQRFPEVTLDDGRLDIVAVRPRPWPTLLLSYLCSRLTGRQPRKGDAVVHVATTRAELRLRHARALTADGEDMGRMDSVSVWTRPAALEVISPGLVSNA